MAENSMNWGAVGLGAAASIPSYVMAYKQQQDLDRLRREGFKPTVRPDVETAVQLAANQAGNAQIAGYGQAADQMRQQQATSMGEAQRAGVSSSNIMNALSRLNQQGLSARRNLAIEGARAKEGRQRQYLSELGRRAAGREADLTEYERSIGALKGGIAQNIQAGTQGILQAGLYGMRYGQPTTPETVTPGGGPDMSPKPSNEKSFVGPVRPPDVATQASLPYVMRPPQQATQETHPYVMAPPVESMDLKQRARYNTSKGALFGNYKNPLGYYPSIVPYGEEGFSPEYPAQQIVPWSMNNKGSFPLSPRQD